MNSTRYLSRFAACSLALALSGTAPGLQAADPANPNSPCPDGQGMMGGRGMGPGMMGRSGMGPGMMDGYGMGSGMMGGYGRGHGMMGGQGMMGPYWGMGLDLTPEQQTRVNQIQDETRKSHWTLMGEMMNQQARLRDLYQAPKRDDPAIDQANKALGKLQQKMYDSSVEAQKRMEAVLTKEQQEKLRTYWRKGPVPEK